MSEATTEVQRTRINLSQNAKGLYQLEVTSEYPTPEEAVAKLGQTVDLVHLMGKERGWLFVSPLVGG